MEAGKSEVRNQTNTRISHRVKFLTHLTVPLAGSPGATARRFQIEVVVAVRCKIFGLERRFEEARAVQVDLLNHQINGL